MSDLKKLKEAREKLPDAIQLFIENQSDPSVIQTLNDFIMQNMFHLMDHKSPSLTKAQLTKVVQWKITRGKFRPILMKYVTGNADKLVENVTSKAFAELTGLDCNLDAEHQLKSYCRVLNELCGLKGVGPATASLLASFVCTDVAFMSDELLAKAGVKVPWKYTMPEFRQVMIYLNDLQTQWKRRYGESAPSKRDLELAIWAEAILDKNSMDYQDGSDQKSKLVTPPMSKKRNTASISVDVDKPSKRQRKSA